MTLVLSCASEPIALVPARKRVDLTKTSQVSRLALALADFVFDLQFQSGAVVSRYVEYRPQNINRDTAMPGRPTLSRWARTTRQPRKEHNRPIRTERARDIADQGLRHGGCIPARVTEKVFILSARRSFGGCSVSSRIVLINDLVHWPAVTV